MSDDHARRPIYTHARQFPHLAGKSDAEIRSLVRDAVTQRPGLIRVLLLRNVLLVLAMPIAAIVLLRLTSLGAGATLVAVGGVVSLFLLGWNLVWVNTVVYQITKPKQDAGST